MENQTANNPNEKNKNSKALLYTIIGVLVVLNLTMGYLYWKSDKKRVEEAKGRTAAIAENKELTAALDEAEFLLKKIREDSAIMATQKMEMSEELTKRKNELANTVAQLRSVKNADAAQIAGLKKQIQDLQAEITKLETENTELKEANARMDEEHKQLVAENEEVKTTNTKITEENTKMKQRLLSESIKVVALKKKILGDDDKAVTRAKSVESISTSFTIAANPEAVPGEKTIYVKITGPGGVTLAKGNEGGVTEFGKEETKYTYKINTSYNGESTKVDNSKWIPEGELKPGTYTVELYCEGFRMGGAGFTLK